MTSSASSSSHKAGAGIAAPARSPLPTLAAAGIVVLLGCAALYHVTLGFRVVSTEDGRRLDVAAAPRPVPFAALDWPSRPLLGDVLRGDGRVAIVSFIYTGCNAVCSVLGSEFQQMQRLIRARGMQRKVRLLSVSFDPRDTPSRLDAYAARQGADRAVWQFAGIASDAQRSAVLGAFGVVVIPAPAGEFVHNAAFHLVDKDGRLAKIDDFDNPGQALADAVAIYDGGRP